MNDQTEMARRWRLILGRYAGESLGEPQSGTVDEQIDRSLAWVLEPRYRKRGLVSASGASGTLDPSSPIGLHWTEATEKLFPKSTFEKLVARAVETRGLKPFIQDVESAKKVPTSRNLLPQLLGARGSMSEEMRTAVRDIISRLVEEIIREIKVGFISAVMSGGLRSRRRRFQGRSTDFDLRATVRANVSRYSPVLGKLVIEKPLFFSRNRRRLDSRVVLLVDQSGSMVDSVLYAAVSASILAAIGFIDVKLVVFDTSVVDLSEISHDPVEVLMTCQLGGGTNIGKAVEYAETLVVAPNRTVVVLISDFFEGAEPQKLYGAVSRLRESGVTLLGLVALQFGETPVYCGPVVQELLDRGMQVATLTPDRFASWLGEVLR